MNRFVLRVMKRVSPGRLRARDRSLRALVLARQWVQSLTYEQIRALPDSVTRHYYVKGEIVAVEFVVTDRQDDSIEVTFSAESALCGVVASDRREIDYTEALEA